MKLSLIFWFLKRLCHSRATFCQNKFFSIHASYTRVEHYIGYTDFHFIHLKWEGPCQRYNMLPPRVLGLVLAAAVHDCAVRGDSE